MVICPSCQNVAARKIRRGRVEERRGDLGHSATSRFPSPLIEPDVRISRIRLSDRLHRKARGVGRTACMARKLTTPSSPNTVFRENRVVPREGTL